MSCSRSSAQAGWESFTQPGIPSSGVAFKVISNRRPKSRELLRRRLRREAQAMAKLRHQNVVSVYDVGESGERLFVAMVNLRRWLRDHERSGPEILAVFREAGAGLAAAHAHGVVHRDFKPDNVLISREGRTMVLDFGLASLAPSEADLGAPSSDGSGQRRSGPIAMDSPDDPNELDPHTGDNSRHMPSDELRATGDGVLTEPGTVLGTPDYVAPEQRRGKPTDERSDQYTFCAALWEALNGSLPFGDRKSTLVRARTARFNEFTRRDVPATVEQALRRGLAWHPEERWPDMDSLLEALKPSTGQRWWWAGGIAVVLGVGLMVGSPSCARAPTHQRRMRAPSGAIAWPISGATLGPTRSRLASRPRALSPSRPGRSWPPSSSAGRTAGPRPIASCVSATARPGPTAMRASVSQRWLALAESLSLDRETQARLASVEAQVLTHADQPDEAVAAWTRALAAIDPDARPLDHGAALVQRAALSTSLGRPNEALGDLERSEALYERKFPPSHPCLVQLRLDIDGLR